MHDDDGEDGFVGFVWSVSVAVVVVVGVVVVVPLVGVVRFECKAKNKIQVFGKKKMGTIANEAVNSKLG